jgi:hypothetical protein
MHITDSLQQNAILDAKRKLGRLRKMARGKRTPEELKRKVRALLFEDDELTGKELKASVEKEKLYARLNISLRSYQNLLKEELPIVKLIKTSAPENTWSLGSLANSSEITTEAVPYLLELKSWAQKQKMSLNDNNYPPLTVRQAKWVSRILPVYLRIFRPEEEINDLGLAWLWQWSRAYSINERSWELSGKEGIFDTSELDAAMLRGDRIDNFGDTYVRLSGKVNLDGKEDSVFVVTGDPKILKKTLTEGPMEKSALSISELPKFKEIMKGNKEPSAPVFDPFIDKKEVR